MASKATSTSKPSTTQSTFEEGNASSGVTATLDEARKKIQHVVIMQENRSFDHYFGTYPGADGIPMQDNVPTVCAPDPQTD